jgi:hypothetical protein
VAASRVRQYIAYNGLLSLATLIMMKEPLEYGLRSVCNNAGAPTCGVGRLDVKPFPGHITCKGSAGVNGPIRPLAVVHQI